MRHGMLVALLVLAAAAPAAAKSRARVVKLTVGPFEIPAHRDREVCRAVRLPNVSGMEVASWEVRMRTSRGGLVGSHHFVAYAYQGSDSAAFPAANRLVDDPGCIGFGPSDFYRTRSFLGGSAGDTRRGAWAVSISVCASSARGPSSSR